MSLGTSWTDYFPNNSELRVLVMLASGSVFKFPETSYGEMFASIYLRTTGWIPESIVSPALRHTLTSPTLTYTSGAALSSPTFSQPSSPTSAGPQAYASKAFDEYYTERMAQIQRDSEERRASAASAASKMSLLQRMQSLRDDWGN